MNQAERTFHLRQFMNSPDGWGSANGAFVGQKLEKYILAEDPALVRIALDGIRQMDVTFAAAALIAIVARRLGSRATCITKLSDLDVRANVAAAAEHAKVPVTAWNGDTPTVLGPQPSRAWREALAFALSRPQTRTTELAGHAGISVANASNRLRQLWAQGYLMRAPDTAPSGGPEHVYRPIG